MFKAIVLEVKDDYVLVMKDDSTVIRIKKKQGLKCGDIIFVLEDDIYVEKVSSNIKRKKSLIMSLGAIAALFIILINPVMSLLNRDISNNIYAVLTFDINPSIEFDLDDGGKIVKVKGINSDANNLNIDSIKGMTVDEGIRMLKEILGTEGYLNSQNSILVGFSFIGNEDITYEENIQRLIKKEFSENDVAYLKGTEADLEAAKNKGVSLGKYEALIKLDEDSFEEAIENLTTQEILELLKANNSNIFLDEEYLEEIQDEVEDRLEDGNELEDDDIEDSDDDEDDTESDKEEDEDRD